MPAILVEVGFINSDSDNTLFDKNFYDIAQAIADGILDTLEEKGLWKPEGARNSSTASESEGLLLTQILLLPFLLLTILQNQMLVP